MTVLTAVAGAQTPAGRPDARALLETIRLAETPYVDASFGYSLKPFSDADIVRQKRTSDDGDMELAQIFHYRLQWAMTVRLYQADHDLTQDDAFAILEAKTRKQQANAEIDRRDKLTLAGRDCVRIAATAKIKGTDWLIQQALIPMRGRDHFVLLFNTPLNHRDRAEALFGEVLQSFQIIRSESMQEILNQALQRGMEQLRLVAKNGTLAKKLANESYLRVVAEGRDAGFLWLKELRTTQNRREGVGLYQEGWLFDPDGTVKIQINEIFLTDDLSYERWENLVRALVPPAGSTPMQLLQTLEKGVREKDQLIIAYTKAANDPKLEDRSITTSSAYASAAFITLFPRLVDLSKPELYAFSAYNSDRKGLIMRSLKVVGPQDILVDGKSVRTIRIEDSEAMTPPISEMFFDTQGRLVRLRVGTLEMISTPKATIASMYGERVTATQRSIQQLTTPQAPAAPAARPGSNAPARQQ